LGEGEGEQESKPKWKRCPKASDISSGSQEDGSRATCSMGQSEGGKEGGVDGLTQRNGVYGFRTKEKARPRGESGHKF